MSRIGSMPVKLPPKVEVTLAGGEISIKGPLGSLARRFGDGVTIEKNGDTLVFKAKDEAANVMHGTVRALVANMVKGVTEGYEKRLALQEGLAHLQALAVEARLEKIVTPETVRWRKLSSSRA